MAFASSRIGAQEAVIIPCDFCEEEEDVNWFCKDCGQSLCKRCKKMHLKGNITKTHELISISDGFIIGKQNIQNICHDHVDPFSFYCKTCKKNICSKCLSHNHKRHDFVDLRVVGDELQKELSDAIKEKTNENETIEQNIESLLRCENELDSYVAASNALIEERVKAIVDATRAEGNALRSCLNIAKEWKTRETRKVIGELKTQSNTYTAKISEIERDLRLQTNLTMPEFVERCLSEFRALKPRHVSIPASTAFFAEGKVNTDVLRDMIGRLDDKYRDLVPVIRDGNIENKAPVFRYQINIVRIIETEKLYSVCSSPDGNIWVGCLGTVLKVDMNGIVLTKIDGRGGYCCHYIACFTSGDAIVSFGGTPYIDRFTLDGKRINIADMSPHKTHDIAVTDENKVVVDVNMNSLLILSEQGQKLREIKPEMKEFYTFCLLQGERYRLVDFRSLHLVSVDRNGKVTRRQKITKSDITFITADRFGNVIASGDHADSVYLISEDGRIIRTYEIPGRKIRKLALDNNGRLLIGTDKQTIIVAEYTE